MVPLFQLAQLQLVQQLQQHFLNVIKMVAIIFGHWITTVIHKTILQVAIMMVELAVRIVFSTIIVEKVAYVEIQQAQILLQNLQLVVSLLQEYFELEFQFILKNTGCAEGWNFGNNFCDIANNVTACAYDGGDCIGDSVVMATTSAPGFLGGGGLPPFLVGK